MKKKKSFSVEQIVSVLKQAELGVPVAEVTRKVGFSELTVYIRRQRFIAGLPITPVLEP